MLIKQIINQRWNSTTPIIAEKDTYKVFGILIEEDLHYIYRKVLRPPIKLK